MKTVYGWLEQVGKLDELINAKMAERSRLLDLATKVTQEISDMPRGSETSDKVGGAAVKLAALAGEIDQLVDQYIDKRSEVVAALEKLSANQYGAMHRYYVRGMTWDQVAADMGKSPAQVMRYRKTAAKNLQQMIGNDSK